MHSFYCSYNYRLYMVWSSLAELKVWETMRQVSRILKQHDGGSMPFVVIKPDGTESEHDCYYPAEQEAKSIPYAIVVGRGIRGMEVLVWPL